MTKRIYQKSSLYYPPLMLITGIAYAVPYQLPQDSDWYELQNSTTYESLCTTGQAEPCDVPAGTYVLINHSLDFNDSGHRNLLSVSTQSTDPTTPPTDSESVSKPKNLLLLEYSSTAAELVWDRPPAEERIVQTEVLRDGMLLSTTEGTSFYDDTRNANQTYQYSLIAIDANGGRSQATSIGQTQTIPTEQIDPISPDIEVDNNSSAIYGFVDGSNTDTRSMNGPINISMARYDTFGELFWEAVPTATSYELSADDNPLYTGDGRSHYFRMTLRTSPRYSLVAFDANGRAIEEVMFRIVPGLAWSLIPEEQNLENIENSILAMSNDAGQTNLERLGYNNSKILVDELLRGIYFEHYFDIDDEVAALTEVVLENDAPVNLSCSNGGSVDLDEIESHNIYRTSYGLNFNDCTIGTTVLNGFMERTVVSFYRHIPKESSLEFNFNQFTLSKGNDIEVEMSGLATIKNLSSIDANCSAEYKKQFKIYELQNVVYRSKGVEYRLPNPVYRGRVETGYRVDTFDFSLGDDCVYKTIIGVEGDTTVRSPVFGDIPAQLEVTSFIAQYKPDNAPAYRYENTAQYTVGMGDSRYSVSYYQSDFDNARIDIYNDGKVSVFTQQTPFKAPEYRNLEDEASSLTPCVFRFEPTAEFEEREC